MNFLVISPILLPLLAAAITVILRYRQSAQYWVGLLAALLILLNHVMLYSPLQQQTLSSQFGEWQLPYGIGFQIDVLSYIMLTISALITFCCLLFMLSGLSTRPLNSLTLPLIFGLIAGVNGSFITQDFFNLYVWFEVILICAIGLLAIGRKISQLDAAFKYMVLNLFGTLLLLTSIALLYGSTGNLNFQAVQAALSTINPATKLMMITLFIVAVLIKVAAFPVFTWMPASYHTLPIPVMALFSALLTKVAVYTLLRSLSQVFTPTIDILQLVLAWIAICTMVVGVLGAAYHWDMRRILVFHSISQIGYILLGISLASPDGNTAAIYYTFHHSIVKACLILIAGVIYVYAGSYDLRKIGGLYNIKPWLAILFAIPALSLVGIPPFSGFWAKVLLLRETIEQGRTLWTAIALIVSVLTLYSMMKIWFEAFCKPHPLVCDSSSVWQPTVRQNVKPAVIAISILCITILFISLLPNLLYDFSHRAALQLGGLL
ncbi:complex I subunit 5 family protein [Testudinibacter sp. TR-2022]|uniref:complex I subunit 5 family protein n=1 Tax=Testudinibacter sp. TR-2022 TaxID=2585029 RepID=UPI001118BA96|nr:proton-conducting transporter membrane subunit [Testudinibacter sp. TR-2022]TNH08024.1 Na+/H+ antiporter subunit D [Pasteurellaceae bacterium Phil11]TNH19166.1 Na+/H+ antiporter subunit D [Testudinibacter sp. TR-2022]TNH22938.1 Na+/H+ antiporter subunit D [Testudinibacter sp. TR-2022]